MRDGSHADTRRMKAFINHRDIWEIIRQRYSVAAAYILLTGNWLEPVKAPFLTIESFPNFSIGFAHYAHSS